MALARLAPQRWGGAGRRRSSLAARDRLRLRAADEGLPRRARTPTRSTPACASRSATGTPSGLTAALGVPGCLWLGARRNGHAALERARLPGDSACCSSTMLLAYSRGALLALLASAARSGSRSCRCGCAAPRCWSSARPAAALVVALWAFAQDGLSNDRVPLDLRTGAGHELGDRCCSSMLAAAARRRAGDRLRAAPRAPPRSRRAGAPGVAILVALALVPVAGAVALAAQRPRARRLDLARLDAADRPARERRRRTSPAA